MIARTALFVALSLVAEAPAAPGFPVEVPANFWTLGWIPSGVQIPADGGLVLGATFSADGSNAPGRTAADAVAYLQVDVTGPGGGVQGSTRWDEDHGVLIWRPLAPLALNVEHTVTVLARNDALAEAWGSPFSMGDRSVSGTFVALDQTMRRGQAPTVALESLSHWVHATEVCCPDPGHAICIEGVCDACQLSRTPLPLARLTFPFVITSPTMPYIVYRAWLEGPVGYALTPFFPSSNGAQGFVDAQVDIALDRYCIAVEERNLVDQSGGVGRVCFDHDDLEVPEEDQPELEVTQALCAPRPDDGCSGGGGGAAGWLAGLALAALRRRARRPDPGAA